MTNMRYVKRAVIFFQSHHTIVMLRKSVNFPPLKSGRPLRSVVISQFRSFYGGIVTSKRRNIGMKNTIMAI